jgi:energy-coupling factor transporter ATP-binding protein EcfA2
MKIVNPYPGLRPFTEKESIFFKGRDLHIRQIIKQLEKNKMVVITGASGDGKSSLVYAGVIPNARAGFFRAEFNQWLVCDFRPERTPLKNLSDSLSTAFGISSEVIMEELKPGFSSLVNLYKNSPYYIEKKTKKWKTASRDEQKRLNSRGGNLLILADQFEEFFTNPENYAGGIPSEEAYITVNLLLETAGISISENLPVYIVLTMRSDFISQSVAFKGLPEYIGYSQFFVPRLQRNELHQVIEEPAKLAGGKISNRLTESLINGLRDGFDQLPVLQYSLSQLWSAADNGNDLLDLDHLEKLIEFPEEFRTTEDEHDFISLITGKQEPYPGFYSAAILSNVLNKHANKLYYSAFEYFQQSGEWGDKNISFEESLHIIKKAFQSLTKTDAGRAVRNRVTLKEITSIINRDHISYETVCGILNIFRLPGNNFIRPYIDPDNIESFYLHADTVLDITHEALFRNWQLLAQWEAEEKENYTNYQDFKLQLNRWKENMKGQEFLLPPGPLAHFENWYNKYRPNKYWLAKYDSSLEDKNQKLIKAAILESDIAEYLKISRDTIQKAERAKKNRRRIISMVSAAIIFVLVGISSWAFLERMHAITQQKIAEEQTRLTTQEKNRAIMATRLAEKERLNAEKSANEAILAKNESEEQKEYAIFLKILAEDQSQKAKRETKRAQLEKMRADEQRTLAEKARNQAILASDSAKALSYLSLARAIALKAQNKYPDKQINLLLAYQAYLFNTKYGGFEGNPEIYDALLYAQTLNGYSNVIEIPGEQLVSIHVVYKTLAIHTIDNQLILYDTQTRELQSKTQLFRTKIPVNTSYFLTDDHLVIGFEDKKQVLVFISSGKKFDLKGHNGLIRSADKNPMKDEFATAGRDKQINIYSLSEGNQSPMKSFTARDRINAIKYTADGNHLIAACNDGSISLWNIHTGEEKLLEKKEGTRALSIGQNKNRDLMAVGFESGELVLFHPNQNFGKTNLLMSNTGIKSIDIGSNNTLLSFAKENRKADINYLKEQDQNSIRIMDNNIRIKYLVFARDDRLYGLCEDNTIRFWEKSNKVYARSVRFMIRRNLSEEEWKMYVGKDVKYEQTIRR